MEGAKIFLGIKIVNITGVFRLEYQDALPRRGSVMFNFMKETKENQKKTANRFKLINTLFVVPLYRLNILPIFFIGRIIALLYVKGRVSGKKRITPVEFRRYNGKVLLFSARGKYGDWFKNIVAKPDDFKIKIGFRKYKPTVKVSSTEEKYEILEWYMEQYPKAAKQLIGYEKEKDQITNVFKHPVSNFFEILQLSL